MPVLAGYLTGVALIVLVGPVLFVLVRTTLERGRRHGLAVVGGIFLSDVTVVAMCALGLVPGLRRPDVQPWIALAGGLLVLGIGARYLLAPALTVGPERRVDATSHAGSFARGFAVNFFNPFVFAVWAGLMALGVSRHGPGPALAGFLVGVLLGILTLDTLKVLLAHRIRPLLKRRGLRVVFRACGALLLVFGIRRLAVGLTSMGDLR